MGYLCKLFGDMLFLFAERLVSFDFVLVNRLTNFHAKLCRACLFQCCHVIFDGFNGGLELVYQFRCCNEYTLREFLRLLEGGFCRFKFRKLRHDLAVSLRVRVGVGEFYEGFIVISIHVAGVGVSCTLVTYHELIDNILLGVYCVPKVFVIRPLGYIVIDADFFVFIPLAKYAPFSLLYISRTPRAIKVMKCHKFVLHVRACAHLLCRSNENTNPAFVHRFKQCSLRLICFGVLDKCYVTFRDAKLYKAGLQCIVYVRIVADSIRNRLVAENKLRTMTIRRIFPFFVDFISACPNLAVTLDASEGIVNSKRSKRCLFEVISDKKRRICDL